MEKLKVTERYDEDGQLKEIRATNNSTNLTRDRVPCPLCERTCECDGMHVSIKKFLTPELASIAVEAFGNFPTGFGDDVLASLREEDNTLLTENIETYLTIVGDRYDDSKEEVNYTTHFEIQYKDVEPLEWITHSLYETTDNEERAKEIYRIAVKDFELAPTVKLRLAKVCKVVAMVEVEP